MNIVHLKSYLQSAAKVADVARSQIFHLGILLAFSIWFIDPFIDALLLREENINQQLTNPDTSEIYFRSISSILIIIFSCLVSAILIRSKRIEELFSKTFHSSSDPISVSSIENDSFIKSSGYSREEVIGRSVFDLGFWVQIEQRDKPTNKLQEKGKVQNVLVDFRITTERYPQLSTLY